MTVMIGSICSGYGGLELGIASAVPGTALTWVADYDPPTTKNPKPKQGAARILAHHWPAVPNLGDITETRWDTTPVVDIICGGTPCQDVSHAGKRKGMRTGTRSGIWASMADAIEHHQPTLVVWENVKGALSAEADSGMEPCPICMGDERDTYLRALGRVLGDLAELGYDAAWCCVRASDVGAPHRRERVFVCAWPASDPGRVRGDTGGVAASGSAGRSHPEPAGRGRTRSDADTDGEGRQGPVGAEPSRREEPPRNRSTVATSDPDHIGSARPGEADVRDRSSDTDRYVASAIADGIVEPEKHPHDGQLSSHPGRSADGDRRALGAAGIGGSSTVGLRSSPGTPTANGPDGDGRPGGGRGVVEWGPFAESIHKWERILGRPAPDPTATSVKGVEALAPVFVEWMMGLPAGHVTGVPGLTRNDQLKALGNGVVPQQAASAVAFLLGYAPEWVRADLGLGEPS